MAALEALNDKLDVAGVMAEICIYGGTTMVLAYNTRLSTKDIDAVFHPKEIIRKLVEEIADERSLPSDWMNDGVKGFLSLKPEFTSQGLPQFSHIQVTRPSAKYLFAMKCIAARVLDSTSKGDKGDVKFLLKELKIETEEQGLKIIGDFYVSERIPQKTHFFLIECLHEIKREGNGKSSATQ